jgi:hypothetical protein
MCDNGQVWCDPRKRVVLRREVMKVRDRRLRGPALGKEPLPGGDLSIGLSIVSEAKSRSGAPTRSSNDGCSGISAAIGSSLRSNASSAGVKSAAATSSPAKNAAAFATAPGSPSDPVKSRTGQPLRPRAAAR